ncbi:MAG: hypothetical protein HN786_04035 [Cellvibrionales bacterium]|jgi:hypothetical protein|nr:hypothetical protein [Cellvibrionales bacterium]
MKKINFNSGDFNTYNDGLSLGIVMDPDSASTLVLRTINGSGFITYLTESDYVHTVKRISFFNNEERDLNLEKSNLLGYPSKFSWVPGQRSSSLSSSKQINNELKLPGGSYWSGGYLITGTGDFNPEDIGMSGIVEGNTIVLSDMFSGGWSGASIMELLELEAGESNIPFIDVQENAEGVCIFDMYSSSEKGCIFSLQIKPDITTELSQDISGVPETRRTYPIYTGEYSERNLIKEWNSIFRINDDSNADSTFDTEEIRDEVYVKEIQNFVNRNWDGMLRDFLWKDSVQNIGQSLSTDEPIKLKKVISYQLSRHGASDDIKIMSEYQQQQGRLGQSMRWHIGLGGTTKLGANKRYLGREYSFVTALNKSIEFSRIYDLPLRGIVSENVKSDKRLAVDIGSSYIESPKNVQGYYPLYLSKASAEKSGNGAFRKFEFNDKVYFMPEGLIENKTFFLGNYDPKIILYNNIVSASEEGVVGGTQIDAINNQTNTGGNTSTSSY